ncbi:MAG TPA: hypothetical protein PKO06_03955 [Candidatus Ozemobacteraceae bacterium]|nr:hypothetical protein [Candidatus Ozemobacteraceae bacterium]
MNRTTVSWLVVVLWVVVSLTVPRLLPALVPDSASAPELLQAPKASASALVPQVFVSGAALSPASNPVINVPAPSVASTSMRKPAGGHGAGVGNWWEALAIILISDAVMSVENVLIIAILVSAVPPRIRVVATFFGLLAAGVFRVVFASVASILMKFPVVALLGAIALIFLTVSIFTDTVRQIRKKQAGTGHSVEEKMDFGEVRHELSRIFREKGFWKTPEGQALKTVTTTVILQDILLSLDNVLVVAGNAVGDLSLTVIGVGVSILMMATMANLMVSIVQKYPVVGFVGGLALAKASYNLFHESYDPETAVVAFGSILVFLMFSRVYHKLTTDEEEEVQPLRVELTESAIEPATEAAVAAVSSEKTPVVAAVVGSMTAPELNREFLLELRTCLVRHNETLDRLAAVLQDLKKPR